MNLNGYNYTAFLLFLIGIVGIICFVMFPAEAHAAVRDLNVQLILLGILAALIERNRREI